MLVLNHPQFCKNDQNVVSKQKIFRWFLRSSHISFDYYGPAVNCISSCEQILQPVVVLLTIYCLAHKDCSDIIITPQCGNSSDLLFVLLRLENKSIMISLKEFYMEQIVVRCLQSLIIQYPHINKTNLLLTGILMNYYLKFLSICWTGLIVLISQGVEGKVLWGGVRDSHTYIYYL